MIKYRMSRGGGMACLPAGRHTRMYYVYILQSLRTNEFYKGISDNLDRRLKQHFAGQSRSTRSKLPLRLIHAEICQDRFEARKLEKYFKCGFGREILSEIADLQTT